MVTTTPLVSQTSVQDTPSIFVFQSPITCQALVYCWLVHHRESSSLPAMPSMLAHHEQGVEKRITECLSEQTRKLDEDLKVLKQSQEATNNMFTTHNPSRVISYKAAEHYKNMTKASDTLFDGNA
jgi:hypothetical protein